MHFFTLSEQEFARSAMKFLRLENIYEISTRDILGGIAGKGA